MKLWLYAVSRMGSSVSGYAIQITKLKSTQRWPNIVARSEKNGFAVSTNSPASEIPGTGWSRIISRLRKAWESGTGRNLGKLFRKPYQSRIRSEERRVGKECRSRWSREH